MALPRHQNMQLNFLFLKLSDWLLSCLSSPFRNFMVSSYAFFANVRLSLDNWTSGEKNKRFLGEDCFSVSIRMGSPHSCPSLVGQCVTIGQRTFPLSALFTLVVYSQGLLRAFKRLSSTSAYDTVT